MTEYGCSICEFTSSKKQHVIRHINRKKSCGPGIKEIIEIPIEIVCKFCNKKFSCSTSLNYHIKNRCKYRDGIKDEEIKKLKEENKLLKESKKVTINNDNSTKTYNIFIVNNYEDTDISKLTDKIYNKIIKDTEAHQIIPRLIKEIHFDPKVPENHNIVLSNRNKNNKHLQIYRNKHWEITDKNTEIANLVSDKETNLSDWVAEKGEKYPEAQEKFNEYIEQKYDDAELLKLIKEEVELVLYNNRHMIKT